MNKLLAHFRNKFAKPKYDKFLYWSILVVLSLYVFAIPSFAGRVGFNIICYFLMAVLIICTGTYLLLFKIKRSFDKKTLIFLVFILSSLIGTISFSHQFRGLLTLLLLSLSFFAIYFAMMIVDNNKLILRVITLAFFVFSLYYLFTYREEIIHYSSYNYDEFRLGWDFENPNTVGSFMTLALSLAMYIVIFQKGYFRFLFLIPTVSFLLVGLTTGSRTFLISVFVLAICYILLFFRKHIFIATLVIIALGVVFVVLINHVSFLATIKFRLDDTLKAFSYGGASGSTLERVLWQKYGFFLSSRRIMFGFGESGFAYASGVMTYTHGNFTEVLCDFGIIGFLLFYCFNIGPAFFALFSKKEDVKYVFSILVVFLLNGLLSVYYYDKCTYVVMALCYYLLDNAKPSFNMSKKKNSNKEHFFEVTV